MANATWEEARTCIKCGLTGELAQGSTPVKFRDSEGKRIHGITPGAVLRKIFCRNSRCKWFNTHWEVQVNPDGSIPDPKSQAPRDKQFRPLDSALQAQMKERFDRLQAATTTEQTSEIRNR